ncbi:MAG: hypothetical protein GX636_06970 [Actinomycetales bacterium]|nr:hypothetical protein [Actinomycetales bacterium]
MKNMKRMVAVIAASGLALGTLPGVANAQSELLGLDLDLLNGSIGLDVGAVLGSEGGASSELPQLPTDSLSGGSEGLNTESLSGGSEGGSLNTESLSGGSEGLNTESLSGGSESGSGEGSLDAGSLTGILESLTGSASGSGEGSSDMGSLEDLNTESLSGGSEGLNTESLSGGSEEGGSLDTESLTGGSEEGGSLDTESLSGGSEEGGSLDTESLSGGSEEGGSLDAGSLEGILDQLTGSLDGGSSELPTDSLSGGSEGLGSTTIIEGSLGEGGSADGGSSEELLVVGALAAGSIGLGLALSGGINLPGLPAIDVAAVCNLPQEAIDFLKDNGSMERHECLPPEEQN